MLTAHADCAGGATQAKLLAAAAAVRAAHPLVEVRLRWFGVEDASAPCCGAEARSLGGLKGSARL